jgi:hypothetical protein
MLEHQEKNILGKSIAEYLTARRGDVISKALKNYHSSSTGDKSITGGNSSNNTEVANPAPLPKLSWPVPFTPSVSDQRSELQHALSSGLE